MQAIFSNGTVMTNSLQVYGGGMANQHMANRLADNSLTCDSEGNCMLKDNLCKAGGCIGKACASVKWADNSLTCDSEGNCMLKDNLGSASGKIKGEGYGIKGSASGKVK